MALETSVTFHGVGKVELIIVQNAEIKKIFIHFKPAVFEKMWISFLFSRTAGFLSRNQTQIPPYSAISARMSGFCLKIMPRNFYQTRKLSTFAFSPIFCYSTLMEGQKMKHENPETKLIREQNQYIRVLEEQLDACKEQIKALELLVEEQNQALALFADVFSGEKE